MDCMFTPSSPWRRPCVTFSGCKLKNLIRDHRHRFIGDFTSISHIDVRRIKDHPEYVADYVLKHAKTQRSDYGRNTYSSQIARRCVATRWYLKGYSKGLLLFKRSQCITSARTCMILRDRIGLEKSLLLKRSPVLTQNSSEMSLRVSSPLCGIADRAARH